MKHSFNRYNLKPSGSDSLGISSTLLQSSGKGELGWDAKNTVSRVDVLDQGDLVAGGSTLAGDDGRVSKEELPDLEPSDTVLGDNGLLVAEPVSVPSPESRRVVDTNGIDGLALETGGLKVVNEESKWGRGVGSWEDVSVHEKTPVEVLKLPGLAKASNLQEESSIIIKHLINLPQEGLEVTDTNVLGHLETSDLVVTACWDWDITVIHAKNSGLLLKDSNSAEARVTPSSLVTSKSDTGDMSAEVDGSKLGESSPTAANVEHSLALLEIDLLADNGELVILELLEALLLVDIRDNAGGVDHAWAKEPAVEIVTSVVVVTDLLLILVQLVPSLNSYMLERLTLRTSVHDDLRCELEEDEFEQADGKSEVGPVGSVLEDLETVAVELNIAIEVHVVEGLHWDLAPSAVLELVGLVLEGEVVLDWAAWQFDLLVLARAHARHDEPERDENWDGGEEGEEDGSLQASADLPCHVRWGDEEQGEEDDIGERVAARTIGWERRIGDGWELIEQSVYGSWCCRPNWARSGSRGVLTLVVFTPQSTFSNAGGKTLGVSMK